MGDIVVVQKGLKPGETIVTEGQLRLEQGTKVQAGDANGTPAEGRRGGGRRGQGGGGEGQGRRGGG
jgi:multidrug efflux system membrane fusion protein